MNKKCNEILNKLEAEGKIKRLKVFEFLKPIELKLRLKDILEKEVDEKYYLKDEVVNKFIKNISGLEVGWIKKSEFGTKHQSNTVYDPNKIIPTITACDHKDPKKILINQLGLLDMKGNEQIRRVYGIDGVSPTLSTMQGGNTQPKILETPCIAASRGRYNSDGSTSQRLEINDTGNTNTITSVQKDNNVLIDDTQSFDKEPRIYNEYCPTLRAGRNGLKITNGFRIRKLTPKECWRLMGFRDDQFEKASKVCSNTQLYKQAGNWIVVPVLERIFENLRYIFEDQNNN